MPHIELTDTLEETKKQLGVKTPLQHAHIDTGGEASTYIVEFDNTTLVVRATSEIPTTDQLDQLNDKLLQLLFTNNPAFPEYFKSFTFSKSHPNGKDLDTIQRVEVMEYIQGDNLRALPQLPSAIPNIFYGIYRALQDLHNQGIFHGDLTLSNIMLGANGLKLIDFDRSSSIETPIKSCYGYPGISRHLYNLKEAHGESQFLGNATDAFALGVLLYQLYTHKLPDFQYQPKNDNFYPQDGFFKKDSHGNYENPQANEVFDIINKLLVINVDERLKNFRELENHPFFKNVNKQNPSAQLRYGDHFLQEITRIKQLKNQSAQITEYEKLLQDYEKSEHLESNSKEQKALVPSYLASEIGITLIGAEAKKWTSPDKKHQKTSEELMTIVKEKSFQKIDAHKKAQLAAAKKTIETEIAQAKLLNQFGNPNFVAHLNQLRRDSYQETILEDADHWKVKLAGNPSPKNKKSIDHLLTLLTRFHQTFSSIERLTIAKEIFSTLIAIPDYDKSNSLKQLREQVINQIFALNQHEFFTDRPDDVYKNYIDKFYEKIAAYKAEHLLKSILDLRIHLLTIDTQSEENVFDLSMRLIYRCSHAIEVYKNHPRSAEIINCLRAVELSVARKFFSKLSAYEKPIPTGFYDLEENMLQLRTAVEREDIDRTELLKNKLKSFENFFTPREKILYKQAEALLSNDMLARNEAAASTTDTAGSVGYISKQGNLEKEIQELTKKLNDPKLSEAKRIIRSASAPIIPVTLSSEPISAPPIVKKRAFSFSFFPSVKSTIESAKKKDLENTFTLNVNGTSFSFNIKKIVAAVKSLLEVKIFGLFFSRNRLTTSCEKLENEFQHLPQPNESAVKTVFQKVFATLPDKDIKKFQKTMAYLKVEQTKDLALLRMALDTANSFTPESKSSPIKKSSILSS